MAKGSCFSTKRSMLCVNCRTGVPLLGCIIGAGNYIFYTLPVLNQLVQNELPVRSRIRVMCCGTGQLTRELIARDYEVTGMVMLLMK